MDPLKSGHKQNLELLFQIYQGNLLLRMFVDNNLDSNFFQVMAQYYSVAVSPYGYSYLVQTVRCWLDGSSTDRLFLLAMLKRPHTNPVESNCVESGFGMGAVRPLCICGETPPLKDLLKIFSILFIIHWACCGS